VVFGGGFVAGFEIEEREIGVRQRFHGAQAFRLVPFADGGLVVTHPAMDHAQGQLRVKMSRIPPQDLVETAQRARQIAGAEGEHGLVVLFLKRGHNCF